jgi:hypothetical protein
MEHGILELHRCRTRYRETGNKNQEYAKTRNQVKSAIRKAKANMEKEIAKNAKSNPKIFWKYANSKRKTNTGISEFSIFAFAFLIALLTYFLVLAYS